MNTICITGTAGFIGHALATALLKQGFAVAGLDNVNDYYDVSLKRARLADLTVTAAATGSAYSFTETDLTNAGAVNAWLLHHKPSHVVHLAAQAGVRYGLVNQQVYLESNLIGHFNMLAGLKALTDAGHPVRHFLYASSSSVYGAQEHVPFTETDNVSKPLSLYAATKRANEMVSHAWANQFNLPSTGLRFFTVYGPWGRPDMSPMLFASAILNGTPIPLYNHGDLWRDFTYVDDIVQAIILLLDKPPSAATDNGIPHRILNLGNQNPVRIDAYVKIMGNVFGKEPIVNLLPKPATEVYRTYADTSALHALVGWAPSTPLAEGLKNFATWYAPRHSSIVV
jgi:UDP-glucuronate 4-epimerase